MSGRGNREIGRPQVKTYSSQEDKKMGIHEFEEKK